MNGANTTLPEIIINADEGVSDRVAKQLVDAVVARGRFTNKLGPNRYCRLSHNELGGVHYVIECIGFTDRSDTFRVSREPNTNA